MKNRKNISRTVVLGIMGVMVLAICLLFNSHKKAPKTDTVEDDKPTVITNINVKEPINVSERKFIFHNADGSIDEVVYLKYLIGKRTPFTEGCYQVNLTQDEMQLFYRYVLQNRVQQKVS